MNTNSKQIIKEKDTGVEVLRILAIFLVVLCHYTQTVRNNPNILVQYTDLLNGYRNEVSIIDNFILYVFRCFGHMGNCMFAVSSAWYLCDSKKTKTNKILSMLLDVIVISLLFLSVYLLLGNNIPFEYIKMSLLPNSYGNNWYITGYLILYAIHRIINNGCNSLSKKSFTKLVLSLFAMYYVICFISGENFYYLSNFMCLIVIYICIFFLKKYHLDLCNNLKIQKTILLITAVFLLCLYYIRFSYIEFPFELYMLNNPLLLLIGYSSFNLFRNIKINKYKTFISNFSSLSLYAYLIHENVLFRNLSRVEMVKWMFENLGTQILTIKVVFIALLIFIASILLSLIYKKTIHRAVECVANKASILLDRFVEKI